MNKIVRKALLKSLGLNLLAGLIGILPFFLMTGDAQITWGLILLVIAVVSLLTQLIVALVYISGLEKKEKGQGMLISIGIFLLIGIAVCSPVWF